MQTRLPLVACLLFACGGAPEAKDPTTTTEPTSRGVDSYALLPGGAIGLGKLEVGALFRAGKAGETLGRLISNYSPLGPESGFSLEHNVDRLICASYELHTADVLCVAEGRFDAAKIDKAILDLEDRAKAERPGALPPVVRTPYAGRTLITAANLGFVVFDATHALAGTENAMRRALDRTRDGATPRRDVRVEFQSRVVDSKADVAAAGTFEGAGFRALSFGPVKIRLLQGLREAYGEGRFSKRPVEPGSESTDSDVTLVTHLVYEEESKAEMSKNEVEGLLGFTKLGASLGVIPRLAHSKVEHKDKEAVVTAGFQDEVLARWLERLPEVLNLPAPTRRGGVTGTVPGADK